MYVLNTIIVQCLASFGPLTIPELKTKLLSRKRTATESEIEEACVKLARRSEVRLIQVMGIQKYTV